MGEARSTWTEIILLAVIAVALYNVGIFLAFSLLPLQILLVRRGEAFFKYGSLVFLAGILGVKLVSFAFMPDASIPPLLVSLDFLLPLALVASLAVVNLERIGRVQLDSPTALAQYPGAENGHATRHVSIPTRLLLAVIVGAVVSLPLVIYLLDTDVLSRVLKPQFQAAVNLLQSEGNTTAGPQGISAEQLSKFAIAVFGRVYAFGFFVMVYLNWHLGTRFARRTLFGAVRLAAFDDRLRNDNIRVPDYMLWPLIAGWGSVLLSVYVHIGFAEYIAWNLALVVGFLYGMQGIGIVQYLFRTKNLSRGLRYLVIIGAVVLLFVPGANLIVLVGFPLLGVSETWIHYRSRRNERSEK